ncbi:TonB-dependent receptor [Sphingomonas sp.]|uniref:TonB-dependent receptor domain-containing protein n=1 Tax=Sphingomonas sp. TaxID=28214 RepID=UPI000DB4CA57|nr:TonB-dependent receptor [Sphingomonas sp.]PZU08158.1 MAG: TonB-dependent receptor [Sphingomonas sp.]
MSNFDRRRRAYYLCTTTLAVLAAVLPAGALQAQTAAPVAVAGEAAAQAASSDPSDIVVTGSRLAQDGFNAPTPVSVVSSADIKLSGTVNVERLLSQSPQFVASATGGSTVSGQGAGQADLNLRGFGATRNLVLVNGRRFAIAGPDQTVDINTIPSALIKRTEIVTGGSSAVYGSDAITGVVNFILDDKFEGVEARAQMNANSPTSAKTYDYSITVGGNFADGRGNVVISANYLKRDAITRRDRGGFTLFALGDGCVVPGSDDNKYHLGTPFTVPSGQSCLSSGGQPGFIFGGSGDIPNSRVSGIPTYAQASSGLRAAYDAAGLSNVGSFGFTFNDAGTTARPALDPADRYNLAPENYLIIPQKRYMFNSLSHFDFTPGVTGYMELHYSQNEVRAQLAPPNVGVATLLNVNNPYLSASVQNVLRQLDAAETGTISVASGPVTRTTTANDGLAVVTLGRRYQEVGPRQANQRRDVFRGAFGFRGDLGDLVEGAVRDISYDVYYTYAKTNYTEELNRALSRSALQASLLSVNGAAPVCNVFGSNISQACVQAISVTATNTTRAVQQVAAATITGKSFTLPAGDIAFDLGVEWRKNSASFRPDQYLASGDVVGWNAGQATGGSISAKEVFGEIRVPLIHDTPFIQALTVNGAFRYSDYSLSGVGGVLTYLGGAEWRVSNDISFRGQYQRAIRAPNVNELYGGLSRTNPLATDPCSSRQPTAQQTAAVRAICVATGVPAGNVFTAVVQPNTFFPVDQGGNPSVGEEKSNTYTFGAVFTPRFLPRFRFSVDYFKITLDGAIGLLGGGLNNTLNLCYNVLQDASSNFCQAIRRDPTTGAITDQYPARILSANTGQMRTAGIDFVLRYTQPLEFGLFGMAETSSLSLGSDWTYLDDFTLTPVAAFPNTKNRCAGAFGQTCGEPLPRWRGTSRLTYAMGPISLSIRHRYVGRVTDDRYVIPTRAGSATAPTLASLSHPRLGDRNYFDLSFTADVLKNIQVFGGANNVFANKPPVVGSAQVRANTYPATYDSIGTEFFLGASVKF